MGKTRKLAVVSAAGLLLSVAGYGMASAVTKSSAATASNAVTVRLGASRPMPAGFFGINYDYGGAAVYVKDSRVPRQLAAIAPGTLRWPGGTGANYFQWRKGYPQPPSGQTCSDHECETDGFQFTLADLAAAYKASGAIPIFDLNIMTSTLTQQIDMLRAAKNTYKLPVKYVELGNELYLPNSDYVNKFPTARDYGMAVAADVKALHKAFPGVIVAAVGSADNRTTRESGWNSGMLSEAKGAGRPNVITLHDHPQYNKSLTTSGLPALFTLPYTSAANLAKVSKTFGSTPTWITEYGLSLGFSKGNPAQYTYANALWESEAAILIAQDVHDATLVNYWAAFGSAVSYAYTASGLTPDGLAMTWLDEAARGARTESPLVFAGEPHLGSSGDAALVGESFGGTRSRTEIVINLSGKSISVATNAAIPSGTRYEQVTGQPVKRATTASQLTVKDGVTGRSMTFAPYSITVVG
jgi:hypothetical protein